MGLDCFDLEDLEKERQEEKFHIDYYKQLNKAFAKSIEDAVFKAVKEYVTKNYQTEDAIKKGASYSNRFKWRKLIKEKNSEHV